MEYLKSKWTQIIVVFEHYYLPSPTVPQVYFTKSGVFKGGFFPRYTFFPQSIFPPDLVMLVPWPPDTDTPFLLKAERARAAHVCKAPRLLCPCPGAFIVAQQLHLGAGRRPAEVCRATAIPRPTEAPLTHLCLLPLLTLLEINQWPNEQQTAVIFWWKITVEAALEVD